MPSPLVLPGHNEHPDEAMPEHSCVSQSLRSRIPLLNPLLDTKFLAAHSGEPTGWSSYRLGSSQYRQVVAGVHHTLISLTCLLSCPIVRDGNLDAGSPLDRHALASHNDGQRVKLPS
jgi:hypothetical protein